MTSCKVSVLLNPFRLGKSEKFKPDFIGLALNSTKRSLELHFGINLNSDDRKTFVRMLKSLVSRNEARILSFPADPPDILRRWPSNRLGSKTLKRVPGISLEAARELIGRQLVLIPPPQGEQSQYSLLRADEENQNVCPP